MIRGKLVRWIVLVSILLLLTAGGYGWYLWNLPQRDVQATPIDFKITATELVQEYLNDAKTANMKYLQAEGNSKILAVTGKISAINTDMKNQKVLTLKETQDKAGVSCTFTEISNTNAEKLKIGDMVTVKGVIRSGAGYDEDLELYEDVIMEKCDVLNK